MHGSRQLFFELLNKIATLQTGGEPCLHRVSIPEQLASIDGHSFDAPFEMDRIIGYLHP